MEEFVRIGMRLRDRGLSAPSGWEEEHRVRGQGGRSLRRHGGYSVGSRCSGIIDSQNAR